VRRHGADQYAVRLFPNVGKILDASEINEQRRLAKRSFIAGIKL